MQTLKIENLTVQIEDKVVLKDFNLTINKGEIHAIMGPNGAGKSTLSKVIMGDFRYKILSGKMYYNGKLLNDMPVCDRALLGIFLAMQMPLEIEGVSNADFLRTALHNKQKDEFNLMKFIKDLDKTVAKLQMDKQMIHRSINSGFSGGERKKNEILQMHILKPSLVLLDEIDSGLDIDSLKVVSENILDYYQEYNPGMLLITHYQKLLNYIKPTHVHIMIDGKIVKSGDYKLVSEIEKNGYENFKNFNSTCIMKENEKNE